MPAAYRYTEATAPAYCYTEGPAIPAIRRHPAAYGEAICSHCGAVVSFWTDDETDTGSFWDVCDVCDEAQLLVPAAACEGRPFLLRRLAGLPIAATRETVIAWLEWNDRNGDYSDDSHRANGWPPLTLSEAWDLVFLACTGLEPASWSR